MLIQERWLILLKEIKEQHLSHASLIALRHEKSHKKTILFSRFQKTPPSLSKGHLFTYHIILNFPQIQKFQFFWNQTKEMLACFQVTFWISYFFNHIQRLFGTLHIFTLLRVSYFNRAHYYLQFTCIGMFSLTLRKGKYSMSQNVNGRVCIIMVYSFLQLLVRRGFGSPLWAHWIEEEVHLWELVFGWI